jgi:hypothetical protein
MGRSIMMRPRSTFTCTTTALLAACGGAVAQPDIGAQIKITLSPGTANGNETTAAAIVRGDGVHEIVAGWNDYRTNGLILTGVAVSSDGGATWTAMNVRPPAPSQSSVEGDPMTAYDQRTGTLWVGGISFFAAQGGCFLAKKIPGVNQFETAVVAKKTSSADKGWAAAGPAPGNPDSTMLYIAYNEGILRSADMGATWAGPTPLGTGIGYLPRVGPDGVLHILSWNLNSCCQDGIWYQRSFDGGVTVEPVKKIATRMDLWDAFNPTVFPGSFRVPQLNYLAIDPDGKTLYVVYFDTTAKIGINSNVDLYFMKSTDGGNSWSIPKVINGDSDPAGDQFFPWLEVDSEGRIHMLFYDTRGIAQNDNAANMTFNAYYSYSDDGGETWSEFQLNPVPFSSAVGQSFFIGDYLGMAMAGDRVYPTYLDTHLGKQDIFAHVITRESVPCAADCNGDGLANVFDFLCFQGLVTGSDPRADCNGDGSINIFDWLCFQGLVAQGC